MKSNFSRFLHYTLSYLGGKPDTASSLSYSGLTRISRWNKFATLFDLDTPVKPECDTLGKSASAGRSMVEMLGVLAIIGVLSVGAIAGYSKAMMKYKLNKQAEQISWLMNIMTQYLHEWKFNEGVYLVPYYIKMNAVDPNMLHHGDTRHLYDPFNNMIKLSNNNSPYYNETLMSIVINDKSSRFETCQNIVNIAQQFSNNLSHLNVSRVNSDDGNYNYTHAWRGDKYCSKEQNNCLRLKTMNDVYEMCKTCNGSARCGINIVWRID